MIFIVDEAQNLTPHEIKTIITRAGEGTKVVFTGDVFQIDTPYLDSKSNGLSYLIDKMKGNPLYAHVNLEKGVLSLSGQRHRESTDESDGMRRLERVSGKFYRRFNLPETADTGEISATGANGILEIIIPKVPALQARKITVEAA